MRFVTLINKTSSIITVLIRHPKTDIIKVLNDMRRLIFPGIYETEKLDYANLSKHYGQPISHHCT